MEIALVEQPGKIMKIPNLSIQQLLEAGVHLGHKTLRWNPKMKKYIFGKRDSVHIIDLTQTLELTNKALEKVYETISNNGKILFISTKKQASEAIADLAKSTEQYFVNYRWLGGMLTNFKTIIKRVIYLKELISLEDSGEINAYPKPERLRIRREVTKLTRSIGGIVNLSKIPDAIFIVDLMNESTALTEANKLGIPVIGLADSNVDPTGVDIVIPGNDDAIRSIEVVTSAIAEACAKGAGLEAVKAEKEGE